MKPKPDRSTPPQLKFDADGLARLSGWRGESDRGDPRMDQIEQDGRHTLHIRAEGGRRRALWRTQVYLARGHAPRDRRRSTPRDSMSWLGTSFNGAALR
jgi:hypothetical protein